MKINVGSANQIKVDAVKEKILEYDFLKDAQVIGLEADSEISDQPKTLDETIKGAMNRAKNSFKDCNLSFGLESGIRPVPYTKTGYMDVCACAIFDGKQYYLGLSSSFEYPQKIIDLVIKKGLNVSQAFHEAGFTENTYIGYAEGAIGYLTKGRLVRKEYTKQSITAALIEVETIYKNK
jgi:inosine/xanthosine triphosphatase